MHGLGFFFSPLLFILSPTYNHSYTCLILTEMKMERSVEFIPPISMSKYSGSSGPTDDKIDRISSLCAWLSG